MPIVSMLVAVFAEGAIAASRISLAKSIYGSVIFVLLQLSAVY